MSASPNWGDSRLPSRFWEKVSPDPNGGCWLWTRLCDRAGYGLFRWRRRMVSTHRLAYLTLVGEHASGLVLDHLCRVRCCCNPAHLEPVTQRENNRRGDVRAALVARGAARTHCPQGHAFTEENTYRPSGHGRVCRRCRADSQARYWRRLYPELHRPEGVP